MSHQLHAPHSPAAAVTGGTSPTIRSRHHPPSPSQHQQQPHHAPSSPLIPSASPEEVIQIGEWKREQILGSGAFGVIVLWRSTVTNSKIAIKQCRWVNTAGYGHGNLDASSTVSRQQRDRWNQEVQLMKRLSHPAVVQSLPVPSCLDSRIADLPCLGMEYCDAGDLRKQLSRAEFCTGLPESCIRRCLTQVSSALLYLHSLRIIHRDLKPENIVLKSRRDGTHDYKLIDLGYCKELDQNSLASSFVGTLQYLAPELFTEKSYSPAVDNWSFGLLIHEIMTGRRPFLPNSTPAQWLPVIKSKKSDEIVAVFKDSGAVVFEKEMTGMTHVSSLFKRDMEVYLRTVLEYDPRKRGGKEAFMKIQDILSKSLVSVFDMNKLLITSYELDPGTNMAQLKDMIQQSTGYVKGDQILLLPSQNGISKSFLLPGSETLIDNEVVVKFLNMSPAGATCEQGPKQDTSKIIYLFDRNHALSFAQYSVTSIIPPSVEKVLLDPITLVTFEDQRLTWSHFIWLSQVILLKYSHLVNGHQCLMHHVMQLREAVRIKMADVIKCTTRLTTTKDIMRQEGELFTQSTNKSSVDKSLFLTKILVTDVKDHVKEVKRIEESYVGKVRKLETLSIKAVNTMFDPHRSDCESIFTPCYRDKSKLYQVYQSMVMMFDEMRKRSKEERTRMTKNIGSSHAFDNTPMVKLLVDLFQLIGSMIRDNYSGMTALMEISSGFNSISREVNRITSECRRTEQELRRVHGSFLKTVVVGGPGHSNGCQQRPHQVHGSSSSLSSIEEVVSAEAESPGRDADANLSHLVMSMSVSSGIGSSSSRPSSTLSSSSSSGPGSGHPPVPTDASLPAATHDVSPTSDWTMLPSIK